MPINHFNIGVPQVHFNNKSIGVTTGGITTEWTEEYPNGLMTLHCLGHYWTSERYFDGRINLKLYFTDRTSDYGEVKVISVEERHRKAEPTTHIYKIDLNPRLSIENWALLNHESTR